METFDILSEAHIFVLSTSPSVKHHTDTSAAELRCEELFFENKTMNQAQGAYSI